MFSFKNIAAFCLCFALVGTSNFASAEEVVTTVKRGEPAPFDGTLFNTTASARLMVDLQYSEEACQLEIDREVNLSKATMQADIDILRIQIDSCQSLCEQRLQIRDEQIDFLTSEMSSMSKSNTTQWFTAGVVAGIGLTVLSGWAIGQAAIR